ncbi:SIMPL domain-containing protein [Planctomycetales bacterium ZRK34]|nr:SIMPL domain-containing protein [Planctomycetales bacterium ZRK34]
MSTARINLFWLIIFTLTLPLAVVVSTQLARSSFEKIKLRGQTITVKGYAELPIDSDRAEWSTQIVTRDTDRTRGYATLSQHRDRLLEYLADFGFEGASVAMGPVGIEPNFERDTRGRLTNTIENYAITQRFSIASTDVKTISQTARDAGDLIREGIELNSSAPTYLYTRLDEMKLKLLGEATTNGRQRAELLVAGSGDRLGPLRSASQGVFQITPAFSTEVSSYGENDTTSLHKVIKAVVTVEYAIAE